MARSALYVGSVMHRRLRPVGHRLRSRLFWLLLDLDEIDGLAERLRLFSRNRFNLFSFYDRDHGLGSAGPAVEVRRRLTEAGIDPAGLRVELLAMPRVLGYGFNPLSIWFCRRPDGSVAAVLHEVHNTFGERHIYLATAPGDGRAEGALRHAAPKRFHVSPFMDMAITYRFRVQVPGERIGVTITAHDAAGPVLVAALEGRRRPLGDRSLFAVALSLPLVTVKVIAAIHWHALRLWLKGLAVRPRPAPPAGPVTPATAGPPGAPQIETP